MHRPWSRRAALLALFALLSVTACRSADQNPPAAPAPDQPAPAAATVAPPPPAPLTAAEKQQIAQAHGLSHAFAAVNRQVAGAVVYIEVAKKQVLVNGRVQTPQTLPDLFQHFFDDPSLPPEFRQRFFHVVPRATPDGDGKRYEVPQPFGAGSGVLFDDQGHILTNNHVVENADIVKVRLKDKREFTATLVGADPRTDLAVLRIQADHLQPARFADSDQLEVGQWVLALGNPFGLDHTLTAGIVSAIGRGNFPGLSDYQQYIQTDAAINRGNSGGALVNLDGQLVGINTWIIAPGGGNVGVGFAIPANLARHVAEQLIAHGKVDRGWLGVQIQELTADLAAAFGLPAVSGALVSEVLDDSPAATAGLQTGDVITALDGRPVKDVNDLRNRVAAIAADTAVPMTVWRDGASQTITVTVGKQPEPQSTAAAPQPPAPPRQPITPSVKKPGDLGVTLAELDGPTRRRLALDKDTAGVLVHAVTPGSPAFLAGVRADDLIQAIDRQPVASLQDVGRILAGRPPSRADRVLLQLLRADNGRAAPLFVVVKPNEGRADGVGPAAERDTMDF